MRWIGRLVALLLSLAVGLAAPAAARASGTATTPAGTSTYEYHAASNTPGMTGGAAFANAGARARPEGPADSPSGRVLARPVLVFVAADSAATGAGTVLKGPIADAVPKNLPEQLALNAAKDGQGTIIMRNLGDAPRLVANYGEGDWVKMQYVLRGTDSNVTVHYFRNLTTKMDVEFKYK